MQKIVEIIEIESSLGFLLPEELLTRLKVKVGDTIYISKTTDGIALSSDFFRKMARFPTTNPGYRNKHGQIVVTGTGFPSKTLAGQTIYHLRCSECGHEYGANGCDIHLRRCPKHQNGAKGEPLRSASPNLFHLKIV